MNKEQLTKTLKPLIKECIKEVIFEEGVLSGIISEVLKGTGGQRIVETRQPATYQQPQVDHEAEERKAKERRKRMLDSIGRDAYNGVDLFEGTRPLTNRDSGKVAGQSAPHGSKALDGVDPSDPGVDLSAFGMSSAVWSKLAKG
jgi:hypothetical protein